MPPSDLQSALRQLITANHILHYYGAVDGFGHISMRHPDKPDVYIMCGYMPPALVEDPTDLIEYYVCGSAPVDPAAPKGYSERFIHGEIFKKYPNVNSVVHSHAEAVLPYAATEAPLLAMYHMSGFLGSAPVPVWDITPLYAHEYQQDMLVNNEVLGASLANAFSPAGSANPERTVVLQKRHGYTCWGKDVPTAVYRTIYTLINAGVQTRAVMLQAAEKGPKVEGLSERHCRDCIVMTEATQDKSWRLWTREVEASPLYRNNA